MRDDELMHYAERGSEFLKHHGIIGQRKGHRRWQNKDGSLTPEGYVHYGYGLPDKDKERDYWKGLPDKGGSSDKSGSSSSGSSRTKQTYDDDRYEGNVEGEGTSKYEERDDDYVDAKYREVNDESQKKDDSKKRYQNTPRQGMQEAINRGPSARENMATAANIAVGVSNGLTKDVQLYDKDGKKSGTIEAPLKTLAKNDRAKKEARARAMNQASIENLSNQQLQAVIDRKNLENRYLDLTTPQVKSGYDKTMEILGVVGAIGATTLTVMNVANMVKEMKG